jgi:urease accessory protein
LRGITTIITPTRIITMNTAMAEAALYDLLTWMSPAWPVGAFAHSSGLEWAVEAGHVTDRATTRQWIADLIEHGPIRNDMVLFVYAWRAVTVGDDARLAEIAELSLATQTAFERRLEATAQGNAFRKIASATLDPPRYGEGDHPKDSGGGLRPGDTCGRSPLHHAAARRGSPPSTGEDLSYPIAVATLTARQAIPLKQALTAYAHGVAANLVSAAQRLVPLGQTDGQLVLRDLRETIFAVVAEMEVLPDGDPFAQLGGAALVAEIGCMVHETQYTRLFRT